MKLFLTGGGESDYFREMDECFLNAIKTKPRLLYIPLAQDTEEWKYGLERIKEVFSTISFDLIEMCDDLNLLNWDYLKGFGGIYIDGGNTFKLMSHVRYTHTFELLHRFLHNGGVINGDSAGAIVLGSHLETAHMGDDGDSNDVELISYQGLNLMGKYAIHAHYFEEHNEEVMEFSKKFGFPIICLHEETGIIVEEKQLKVITDKNATIINGSSLYKVEKDHCFNL